MPNTIFANVTDHGVSFSNLKPELKQEAMRYFRSQGCYVDDNGEGDTQELDQFECHVSGHGRQENIKELSQFLVKECGVDVLVPGHASEKSKYEMFYEVMAAEGLPTMPMKLGSHRMYAEQHDEKGEAFTMNYVGSAPKSHLEWIKSSAYNQPFNEEYSVRQVIQATAQDAETPGLAGLNIRNSLSKENTTIIKELKESKYDLMPRGETNQKRSQRPAYAARNEYNDRDAPVQGTMMSVHLDKHKKSKKRKKKKHKIKDHKRGFTLANSA